MTQQSKTILITGSGSGIGKATAIALAEKGHTVIATTETDAQAIELNKLTFSKNISITSFRLDVTNANDRSLVLNYDIDVLINNAGIGESGSLAEIDMNKVRNNYEVNVFGPLELTQLVLKGMIKKDKGTVIFISSLLGRITMPFLAPYSMTKFSISSGAEALRKEIQSITPNVHICLVEPSGYHTGFNQKNIAKKFVWMNEQSFFYKIKDKIKKNEDTQFRLIESKTTDSIVEKIVHASESGKPKLRYVAPWAHGFGVQVLRMFGK
ncbi:MAG: SDR family oxidoreductase [Cytophagales bacterium]|nr:SDR family oxidoreductase [Cytophaga sp.]